MKFIKVFLLTFININKKSKFIILVYEKGDCFKFRLNVGVASHAELVPHWDVKSQSYLLTSRSFVNVNGLVDFDNSQ